MDTHSAEILQGPSKRLTNPGSPIASLAAMVTMPAIYDCVSRVVNRRFVFEDRECEHFRKFMRMQETRGRTRTLWEERFKSVI